MLIIVDEGVYVYYVEGCMVLIYLFDLLYFVVVEIVVKEGGCCCYMMI